MTMRDGTRTTTDDHPMVGGTDPWVSTNVPWSGRLRALLFAARYDAQVESGVRAHRGSPLAAHYARLSSRRERRALEQSLTNVMRDAGLIDGGPSSTTRVPIQADAVAECVDLVCDVLARLASPLPVRGRGMARLRTLLSDGRGPLYRRSRGTLAAALRGVIAAM